MTARQEFTKKDRLSAFDRSGGNCEVCTAKLFPGNVEYDHRIPAAIGGDATLDNCVVTCRACHRNKTFQRDIPAIAKTRRIRIRQAGIRKSRTILGGRRFDGSPIRYARER